jgi:hypothetical protein
VFYVPYCTAKKSSDEKKSIEQTHQECLAAETAKLFSKYNAVEFKTIDQNGGAYAIQLKELFKDSKQRVFIYEKPKEINKIGNVYQLLFYENLTARELRYVESVRDVTLNCTKSDFDKINKILKSDESERLAIVAELNKFNAVKKIKIDSEGKPVPAERRDGIRSFSYSGSCFEIFKKPISECDNLKN